MSTRNLAADGRAAALEAGEIQVVTGDGRLGACAPLLFEAERRAFCLPTLTRFRLIPRRCRLPQGRYVIRPSFEARTRPADPPRLLPSGPYDCIHVGAAAPEMPQALIEQLASPGRMFIPVGSFSQGPSRSFACLSREASSLTPSSARPPASHRPGRQGRPRARHAEAADGRARASTLASLRPCQACALTQRTRSPAAVRAPLRPRGPVVLVLAAPDDSHPRVRRNPSTLLM